ncbi:MAG: hypothetical protein ACRBDX_00660 [Gammaproteobacteria bacterium]
MDKEVKDTVRKIFNNLRKKQPKMQSRRSDRVDVEKLIRDYQELDPQVRSKD